MKLLFPILCAALIVTTAACGSTRSPTDPSQVTGVAYSQTDLVVGNGKVAANGNTVSTNYTLWLYNSAGTDSKGAQLQTGPFTFVLGVGQVIKGFDQGVVGMAVGALVTWMALKARRPRVANDASATPVTRLEAHLASAAFTVTGVWAADGAAATRRNSSASAGARARARAWRRRLGMVAPEKVPIG